MSQNQLLTLRPRASSLQSTGKRTTDEIGMLRLSPLPVVINYGLFCSARNQIQGLRLTCSLPQSNTPAPNSVLDN